MIFYLFRLKPIFTLFLALLIGCSTGVWAQTQPTGRVLDAANRSPLAFAVVQNTSQKTGVQTDLDGKFTLKALANDSLRFSAFGYLTQTIAVKDLPQNLEILLKENETELSDVVILPTENPAHRIIRLAIANRARNNPDRLASFQYRAYNKVKMAPPDRILADSSKNNPFLFADLLIWESITNRRFLQPNFNEETVVASKISGVSDAALPFSPTELQDLSFYNDWTTVLGMKFLSPIADNAVQKYRFDLRDTLYDGADTVFVIYFEPRTQTLAGFQGTLMIHTNGYAIQSIDADAMLAADVPIYQSVRIKQQHTIVNDSVWFPNEIYTEFSLSATPGAQSEAFNVGVRTNFKDIKINPLLNKRDFDEIELTIGTDAAKKDTAYWRNNRTDTLSRRERNTYTLMDSLGRKRNFGKIIAQFNKLLTGFITIGPVDLNIRRLYEYNQVEKHRLGLGLQTNERLSPLFNIGGWFGYGTGDKRWKYGGYLYFHPFKDDRYRLHYNYDQTLLVTGSDYLGFYGHKMLHLHPDEYFTTRKFFIPTLDYVERHRVGIYAAIAKRISGRVGFSVEKVTPGYEYCYDGKKNFQFTEFSAQIRWAPREVYYQLGRNVINKSKGWPVVEARAIFGLKNVLGGGYNYQQYQVSVAQDLSLNGWSRLDYVVTGGFYQGSLPFQKLYVFHANGNPNFAGEPKAFNAMDLNSFCADRFLTGNFFWRIQNQGFPSKRYSPDLTVSFGTAWGNLSQPDSLHTGFVPKAPEKGYFEMGLALNNLLPMEVIRIVSALQFFGVGVYYRFGAYASPDQIQNFSVKLEYTIRF